MIQIFMSVSGSMYWHGEQLSISILPKDICHPDWSSRDWSTNLPNSRWFLLPSELQLPTCYSSVASPKYLPLMLCWFHVKQLSFSCQKWLFHYISCNVTIDIFHYLCKIFISTLLLLNITIFEYLFVTWFYLMKQSILFITGYFRSEFTRTFILKHLNFYRVTQSNTLLMVLRPFLDLLFILQNYEILMFMWCSGFESLRVLLLMFPGFGCCLFSCLFPVFAVHSVSVFCPFVVSVSNVSISVYCPVPVSSLCLFLSLHYFLFYFVQRLSHICSDLLPLSHNSDYFLCSLVYSITSLITSCVFKPLVFFNWWSPPHITVCVLSSIWQCRFSVSLLQFKCLMCWHICLGQLIKLRMVHSAFHTTIPWQVFVISNAKQLKIVLHVHLSYVWILHHQA